MSQTKQNEPESGESLSTLGKRLEKLEARQQEHEQTLSELLNSPEWIDLLFGRYLKA